LTRHCPGASPSSGSVGRCAIQSEAARQVYRRDEAERRELHAKFDKALRARTYTGAGSLGLGSQLSQVTLNGELNLYRGRHQPVDDSSASSSAPVVRLPPGRRNDRGDGQAEFEHRVQNPAQPAPSASGRRFARHAVRRRKGRAIGGELRRPSSNVQLALMISSHASATIPASWSSSPASSEG
jgi:hypothetical protein